MISFTVIFGKFWKFQSSCIPRESCFTLPIKCLLEFRGNTHILNWWACSQFLQVAVFLRTQSIMLGFYFILVASITVTWATSFGGLRFKLEAEDTIFYIFQRTLPNFRMKILVLCSAKSLCSFYFSLFCFHPLYTCSKFGWKYFKNGYISFFYWCQFFLDAAYWRPKLITCQSKEKTTTNFNLLH